MAIGASRLATEWEVCSPETGDKCSASAFTLPIEGLRRVLAISLEISSYLFRFVSFKQGLCCAAKVDPEPLSLLPLPAQCWDEQPQLPAVLQSLL